MAEILLGGTVGDGRSKNGISHNEPEDVITIRNRFIELGYSYDVEDADGKKVDWLSKVTSGSATGMVTN